MVSPVLRNGPPVVCFSVVWGWGHIHVHAPLRPPEARLTFRALPKAPRLHSFLKNWSPEHPCSSPCTRTCTHAHPCTRTQTQAQDLGWDDAIFPGDKTRPAWSSGTAGSGQTLLTYALGSALSVCSVPLDMTVHGRRRVAVERAHGLLPCSLTDTWDTWALLDHEPRLLCGPSSQLCSGSAGEPPCVGVGRWPPEAISVSECARARVHTRASTHARLYTCASTQTCVHTYVSWCTCVCLRARATTCT